MAKAEIKTRYQPPVDLSKYAWLSIGAAVLTISFKGFAAILTSSVGLFSDAIETLVNLVAAIIALLMLKQAIKPPDERFQFGRSKAEYFSAATEGVMIFVAATVIIYSAIERIINPLVPRQLGIGLLISVLASLVNGGVAVLLLRAGRKHNSATLIADGKHLFTDVITSAAVLLGVGLVLVTKIPLLDPIVALIAGANIAWTGFTLIRDAAKGLLDAALPAQQTDQLMAVLNSFSSGGEIDFHNIKTRQSGTRAYMSFHILVPDQWTVKKGHEFTEQVIDELVKVDPQLRVSAHLEPINDPLSYQDMFD